MKYRQDIQILRGVSVLWVVLYHFDISVFHNGFLGVDVFFVISGFLMASLYKSGDAASFYQRRASRLLPAYFVVVVVSLIASFIFTTLNESSQVLKQVYWASTFASNVGFWSGTSYFSKSHFTPLLHLWSLGVEIQFYFFVPVLYWIVEKSKKAFLVLVLISFVCCIAVQSVSPKTAFFLMPFRLWELGVGFFVGYVLAKGNVKTKLKSNYFGVFGFVLVCLVPFSLVDGKSSSFLYGHPGFFALIAVLGTAFVLYFGVPVFILRNRLGTALELLGKYSYSIYLVHFPVLVIYLSEPFAGTSLSVVNPVDYVVLVAIIFVCSLLLHKYVENRWRHIDLKNILFVPLVVVLVVAVVTPVVHAAFISSEEKKIFSAFSDRAVYRCGKLFRVLSPSSEFCELTGIGNPVKRIMLIGNSHSDSIKTVFASAAKNRNQAVYFSVSNRPLMRGGPSVEKIVQSAVESGVSRIVLHYSLGQIAGASANFGELFESASERGIDVVLIDPIPTWNINVPRALYSQFKYGRELPVQSWGQHKKKVDEIFNSVENSNLREISRFDPAAYFCNENCKLVSDDGLPLYFDNSHLTLTGSQVILDLFENVLELPAHSS